MFASLVGAEVIDVLPMEEIMFVKIESDSQRRTPTLDLDRADAGSDDGDEAAPTSVHCLNIERGNALTHRDSSHH